MYCINVIVKPEITQQMFFASNIHQIHMGQVKPAYEFKHFSLTLPINSELKRINMLFAWKSANFGSQKWFKNEMAAVYDQICGTRYFWNIIAHTSRYIGVNKIFNFPPAKQIFTEAQQTIVMRTTAAAGVVEASGRVKASFSFCPSLSSTDYMHETEEWWGASRLRGPSKHIHWELNCGERC